MIKFRDLAVAAAITGAGIAASFAIAGVPAHAATVTAPHATSCAVQLRAVDAAERGQIGARGLAAAGLPELAATARGAGTLAGARWYGVALEAAGDAIADGRGGDTGCAAGPQLPSWFRWGGTSDRSNGAPCIAVWGQQADGRGNTSAEICGNGSAGLS